ncbi:MAG TPA: MFS transporter [Candidatus Acidoferrales bacterium]|nr:MFS transporter [Candidatus Acidoferrales bacterium]
MKPTIPPSSLSGSSLRYAWYVVGVLTLIYTFSFIDRQIFSLLVGPLRRDLHISDTQVSLLIGFSFAVFYTFFGILLGRLTDVYSRRAIIAIGLFLWSLLTTGCGLARTFPQMLLLRMGVGVGEAALSPAAYSLITDYFPRRRLATAISVYSMGIYVGSGMSFLLGGLVVRLASTQAVWNVPLFGAIRPWQLIFLTVGLPGIALVPLLLTVREPAPHGTRPGATVPMRRVFAYIVENRRTFLLHNIGFGLLSLASYAGGAWVPEFYRRHFHWPISTIGVMYGAIVAVFGSVGITGGGRLADYVRATGRDNATLLVGTCVAVASVPISCLFYLAPSATWATVWLIPSAMLAAAPFGIAPAAIQQMMPVSMRGQASAIYLFILNLIGLGAGPTAVAVFTQYVFKRDDALPYSLAIVASLSCTLAALLLYGALKPFLASLTRLHSWNADNAAVEHHSE